MAVRYRKAITLILICLMTFTLVGCDYQSADELLFSAASSYADGKPTEALFFQNTDDALDEQMLKFVASYLRPEQEELSEEEYIELMRRIYDPDFSLDKPGSETTETSETSQPSESASDATEGTTPAIPSDSTVDTETTQEPSETEPVPSESSGIPVVSSLDELVRVFEQAYLNLDVEVVFRCDNGFDFHRSTDLNYIEEEIQRHDPNLIFGIKKWWTTDYGDEYRVATEFYFTLDEISEMREETYALLQSAVAKIDYQGKSDYEIVVAVNQYLCDTVYYPEEEPYAPVTHTPYGAFHDGCAVCEGYACAAKMMLTACGVESDIEVGETPRGGHAWNLVKVDGQWYQLDVCWNDGGITNRYFLVSDELMKQSRTWDEDRYPACPYSYSERQAA